VSTTGTITGITVTNAGSGYASAPTVTFSSVGTTGTGARATTTGSVAALLLNIPDPLNPGTAGGGGYDNLVTLATVDATSTVAGLTITLTAPPVGGVTATAGATGKVFDITFTNLGKNYTSAPTVAVTAPVANTVLAAPLVTAAASTDTAAGVPQGRILVKTKAIQELFEPTYGRLNATLGVEIPFTSALTQTTIPLGYVDQATEEFADGEVQIWKITHNGVDSHPVHFHLLNVQLINRVGWDNFVTPPEPNELGWKETVKMSPLEDVIVAVRAKKPTLPGFGLPNSQRLQDPTQPEGAMTGFTQIDPNTGLPAPMTNMFVDYGWEYVWHCHILGHEENDFMRAIKFNANEAMPIAGVLTGVQAGSTVALNWTDLSQTEFMYRVERAAPGGTVWTVLDNLLANSTKYVDLTAGLNANYDYRVVAVGQAGEVASNVVAVRSMPSGLGALTFVPRTIAPVTLNWGDATAETSYQVQRAVSGSTNFATIATLAADAVTYTDNTAVGTTAYVYRVIALNASGQAVSNTVNVPIVPLALPGAPRSLNGNKTNINASMARITLTWRAPTTGGAVASYIIQSCSGPTNCTNFTQLATTANLTYTTGQVNRGTPFSFRIQAVNAAGKSTTFSNVFRVTP
jgi:hypothetical protein